MVEQQVYGIEENKDGEITDLYLSPLDMSIKEKVAYDGACKNLGNGEEYCVYDKHGIKHKLQVNEKGEIVTEEKKKLKDVFSKEVDAKKMAQPEEKTTKVANTKGKK